MTPAQRGARNRAAGKRWERELREGLREEGMDVESLRLHGKEDEGDMVIRLEDGRWPFTRLVVEAKNVASIDPARFSSEAVTEATHYARNRGLGMNARGIAIVKRRGKSWKDAYVITTVRELFGLE